MKSKLLFTMATCFAASFAFAQGTPSDSTSEPSSSAKIPQTTSGAGSSTAEIGKEVTPAGGESTAAIETVVPSSPLGKFSISLLNETSFNKSSITDKDADAGGINRVQLGYKLSDTKLLSAREDFSFALARTNDATRQETKSHVNDPFVAYTDTKLTVLPGDWTVTLQARYFIPIGESSRMVTKSAGAEALLLVFDKSVGKLDLEFYMLGQVNNNTQDYTYAAQKDGTYKAVGNPDWSAIPAYAEVGYNFTDKLELLHDMGLLTSAKRSGPGADYERKNVFYNETYLAYAATKMLTVMASIEDDATLESNNAVRPYQDNDVAYNLYLKFKL